VSKRREPRKELQTAVRIFGTDSGGQVFSEKVSTVNISQHGVELSGVTARLNPEETIGLSYANNRAHFRVKWVGQAGTPKEGHVGLLNTAPEKPLWDFPLPAAAPDSHRAAMVDGRKHPRFKCGNSIELHTESGASFWGAITDLSVGGCYIEMALPVAKGSKLNVGIWIGDSKVKADGEVVYSTQGLGFGVKFTKMTEAERQRLSQYLETLGPFSRKR